MGLWPWVGKRAMVARDYSMYKYIVEKEMERASSISIYHPSESPQWSFDHNEDPLNQVATPPRPRNPCNSRKVKRREQQLGVKRENLASCSPGSAQSMASSYANAEHGHGCTLAASTEQPQLAHARPRSYTTTTTLRTFVSVSATTVLYAAHRASRRD